jgi:hypothetical protein|nr:MAG TPA: hypothetical protein [Caudoviricetes sp.]
MTNYEKLQAEAKRTKELVNKAIIIIPADSLEFGIGDIKKLAELVDERMKMTEGRTEDRREESARINVQYVRHHNQRLLEIIESYN